ncbi:methyl-accepting chemotaxis protein [Pseudohongiella nitratireducens]|uniref:Methyl-accepting chemotaxis protein n=1 Tax=Pseudohongiella nitratireducens TaxID=1768907 RepID=A0A917GUV8_9GAMM|nr:methyl-accepting chemotaxis protein [Pseudohongiella nitratireducens]MDF1623076.1 methyl-accepting chemotaxis protein [Pseudohongiella nitratireducens]GGG57942.1 methyl-accepting chemotaxis protein [Pseudohongiella nitratireducens]
MFSKFSIRARIGFIVAISVLSIIGLSVSLLWQARGQFIEELRQSSVSQVEMVHDALSGLYEQVQSGEMTDSEAKRLGRYLINNTVVSERNYLLLYHRLGQILAHPFRGVDSALDTDQQVRASLASTVTMTEAERLEQSGYREPAPTMTEIIERYTGSSYTGFAEYAYHPEQEFGYRLLTYTDDPLAHPESENKTIYAKQFEPWGWVIIHGLYEEDINAQFNSWAGRSAAIVAVILLVLAVLAYSLSRSITQPLMRARAYMHDIAQGSGDLSQRLQDDGEDEISQMGQSFNTFVSKLSDIIRQVLQTNADVTEKSTHFSSMIERTAGRSSSQLEETELLASSTTELSSSLADVAHGAQTSVDAASEANSATEKATDAVSKTRISVEQLSGSMTDIQVKVHDMRDHNEKVHSVLEVIQGIAEQTNLLALNAAIEAARAGEQGRGFAVVADEVRSLAQKTQASTHEINTIIQNLQDNTAQIVTAMDGGVSLSKECVGTANSANELLESVLGSVALITERSRDIASAVSQQSEVTDGIAKSSVKIAGDGRLNTDDYLECQQYQREINEMLRSLDEMMSQFKLG